MKDARAEVDALRREIPDDLRRWRDLDFTTRLSDQITLSTFHGCPAGEIEGIVRFLLTEMDVHVTVKLNPTLLGRETVDGLLHDVMGYDEVRTRARGLRQGPAVGPGPRDHRPALGGGALARPDVPGQVLEHAGGAQPPDVLPGGGVGDVPLRRPPARGHHGAGRSLPARAAAGADLVLGRGGRPELRGLRRPRLHAHHDLHRPPEARRVRPAARATTCSSRNGCARWARRGSAISWCARSARARRPSARRRRKGRCATRSWPHWRREATCAAAWPFRGLYDRIVARAAVLNTPLGAARAAAEPRYRAEKNRAAPRKIGSHLVLFDCINCDKCVPVCPNDANFVYETAPLSVGLRAVRGARECGGEGPRRPLRREQGASDRELPGLLQRVRQLRRLLSGGRRALHREAAASSDRSRAGRPCASATGSSPAGEADAHAVWARIRGREYHLRDRSRPRPRRSSRTG